MHSFTNSQLPATASPALSYSTPVLRLEKVRKQFNQVIAVNDISIDFFKGEYFCILGPSGCGKTTLLRLLAGFEEPNKGKIFLEDQNVENIPAEHRNVNMMFQNYALFPHMKVYDNIAFGLRMKKMDANVIRQRVGEALEMVNLGIYFDRYPRQLSGGEQQRVALVRALVNHPAVLLLDEPLGALDQNLRLEMQMELKKIQRSTGITFIHVTHDQDEALTMSDRLAIMKDGQFTQAGPPHTLYNQPINRFVAEFLGMSNIIETTSYNSETREITLENLGHLRIDHEIIPQPTTDKLTFLVRPEKIRLSSKKPDHDHNIIKGEIINVKFSGSTILYIVHADNLDLKVTTLAENTNNNQPIPGEGNPVYLYIPPTNIIPLTMK